jgi:hypothetical protein
MVYLAMIFWRWSPPPLCMRSRETSMRDHHFLNFIGLWWFVARPHDKSAFDNVTTPMFFGFFVMLRRSRRHDRTAGERLIRAAEELAMLRTVFGAMGITLLGARLPPHALPSARLADHFGGRRSCSPARLARAHAGDGMSPNAARSRAAQLIRQQAGILALNDAFVRRDDVHLAGGVIWPLTPATRPRSAGRRSPGLRPKSYGAAARSGAKARTAKRARRGLYGKRRGGWSARNIERMVARRAASAKQARRALPFQNIRSARRRFDLAASAPTRR